MGVATGQCDLAGMKWKYAAWPLHTAVNAGIVCTDAKCTRNINTTGIQCDTTATCRERVRHETRKSKLRQFNKYKI